MDKRAKNLLWFFIQQAEKASTERQFCILITQKILPLLRKIYPNVCIEYPYPAENTCFEERERYLKVLHYGGDFKHYQIQEFSLLQLRKTQSYKKRARSDEPKILYQLLYLFEKMWNNEFRDFFRKKIPYSSNPKYKTSKYQNKTKGHLTPQDENRDLDLINRRMEQSEINSLKGKTAENTSFATFPIREQLAEQVRIEYDKSVFGFNDVVLQSIAVNLSSTVEAQGNIYFTKQKIIDYIKAIIGADDTFVPVEQQLELEPISIDLETDEPNGSDIRPKTLYLLTEWTDGITEKIQLWRNDKQQVNYTSYFVEHLLHQKTSILSIPKPKTYNVTKYLKRAGIPLVLQHLFGINKKIYFPKVKISEGKTKILISDISPAHKLQLLSLIQVVPFTEWDNDLAELDVDT